MAGKRAKYSPISRQEASSSLPPPPGRSKQPSGYIDGDTDAQRKLVAMI
jgi:hypothetical protein